MSKHEIVEAKNHLPALTTMFEEDAGSGFENADKDSYSIPFLSVLQSGSPQCKKSDGAYIKGAEEGHIFNSVTQEIFDGEEGLLVVPCHYVRSFVKWAPRNAGGGFLGEFNAADPVVATAVRNAEGQDVLPDGNLLVDTRSHYVLVLDRESGSFAPALISMSSTNVKVSRRWMSVMDGIQMKRGDGSFFRPAMFSHVYKLTTVPQSNDHGSWYSWKVEKVGPVEDHHIYAGAKSFRDGVRGGEIKAAPRASEPEDKDVPF